MRPTDRYALTIRCSIALLALLTTRAASATEPAKEVLPSIATKAAGLDARPGLLDVYLDRTEGSVLLRLAPPGKSGIVGEYLYTDSLLTGLGSNPVGLDRGQLGNTRLIRIRRIGNRVLVEIPNLDYRASTDDPDERLAVEQSFATSVIWGGAIVALDPDGSALVDATTFVVRDAHGVVATLRDTEQGTYALDQGRSVVDFDGCLAFPDNLELEAIVTFTTSGKAGGEVRTVAPEPESVTLVQHHSIIRLPPPGYRPRRHDPRGGSFAITFRDYAVPLTAPLDERWIVRHRLDKVDPGAERSRVKEPIVYYVDRGAPEPVRSALLDGARWWAQAFVAAGFIDAFRVELLPEGAHPLDVRYNVIQWVHRATRGWSYGGGVTDPRTGEMLKGHVSLGSQRVRHDRLLFEGLVGTGKTGSGAADDPIELALARIRQLAAHEVGHTLGLAHNFAASTYGDRASVMDYPAPLIGVTAAGNLDLTNAYAVGVGTWDTHAIRFAYADPPGGASPQYLEKLLLDGIADGHRFLTDEDARDLGAAQPLASLWDNGPDPVTALAETMRVRRIALDRFGRDRVAVGQPLALLEEVLATVYFHHRYQVEAAVKLLGGVDYRYAVNGDGQPPLRPVAASEQQRAIAGLLATLDPVELDLPESILELIHPRPFDYPGNREQLTGHTAPTFDPLAAASAAGGLVVGAILEPHRMARLVDQHRRLAELPAAEWVMQQLIDATFAAAPADPRRAEIARAVQLTVVEGLLELAADRTAATAVRARAEAALESIPSRLGAPSGRDPHAAYLARMITRRLDRGEREASERSRPRELPPGSPIGLPQLSGCSVGDD